MKNTALKLYVKLSTKARALADDSRGLTAVEYAVLGAFVVVAVGAVGQTFQSNLGTAFARLWTAVPA